MSVVNSICVAGFVSGVSLIVAAFGSIAVRAEQSGPPAEAVAQPTVPSSPAQPKRVPTTIIRSDGSEQKRAEPVRTEHTQKPAEFTAPPKRVRTIVIRNGQPMPKGMEAETSVPPRVNSPAPASKAQQDPTGPQRTGVDRARYRLADLDELMQQRRPERGIDLYPATPVKIIAALTSYGEPCNVSLLHKSMVAAKDWLAAVPITRCIKIRSAQNSTLPLFIQDKVAEFLPKEVPLGSALTLYAIHVFTSPEGPGLLVNEFSASIDSACECGPDMHPGADFSAPEGTPVPAADDGVVVKVEQDEQAVVDAPTAGHCGRYVVIKHSYPNGQSVFTRYAQLGRVVGGDGKPLAVGMQVKKSDKVGEIGSRKFFHFEVRPVNGTGVAVSAGWLQRYAADSTMQWSRFKPVDPKTFDFATYGGTDTAAAK